MFVFHYNKNGTSEVGFIVQWSLAVLNGALYYLTGDEAASK
jgi:hypothetical protein